SGGRDLSHGRDGGPAVLEDRGELLGVRLQLVLGRAAEVLGGDAGRLRDVGLPRLDLLTDLELRGSTFRRLRAIEGLLQVGLLRLLDLCETLRGRAVLLGAGLPLPRLALQA